MFNKRVGCEGLRDVTNGIDLPRAQISNQQSTVGFDKSENPDEHSFRIPLCKHSGFLKFKTQVVKFHWLVQLLIIIWQFIYLLFVGPCDAFDSILDQETIIITLLLKAG